MNGNLKQVTFTVAESNGNVIISFEKTDKSLIQLSFRTATKQLAYVVDGKEVVVFHGQ